MIDWAGLTFNGLWVLGAAVILAALSFSHYEAQRRGVDEGIMLNHDGDVAEGFGFIGVEREPDLFSSYALTRSAPHKIQHVSRSER